MAKEKTKRSYKHDTIKVNEPLNKIREIRSRMNMTQKEFGEMVGIHWTNLCKLERSGKQPSIRIAERIAKATGLTVADVRGYGSAYVRSDIYMPTKAKDYLCTVRTPAGQVVRVLAFNPQKKEWYLPDNGVVVASRHVRWWADIPTPPEDN